MSGRTKRTTYLLAEGIEDQRRQVWLVIVAGLIELQGAHSNILPQNFTLLSAALVGVSQNVVQVRHCHNDRPVLDVSHLAEEAFRRIRDVVMCRTLMWTQTRYYLF